MKKKRINLYKPAGFFGLIALILLLLVTITMIDEGGFLDDLWTFINNHLFSTLNLFVWSLLLSSVFALIQMFRPSVVRNNSCEVIVAKKIRCHDCVNIEPNSEMRNVDGIILNGRVCEIFRGSNVVVDGNGKIIAETLFGEIFYNYLCKKICGNDDSWNAIFKYCQSINVDFSTQSKRIAPKSEIRYFFSFPIFYEICLIGFTSIYIFEYAPFFSSNEFLSKLNEFIFDDLMPVSMIIFIATLICGPFYGALSSKVENKTSETIKVKCYGRSDYFELEPGYEMSDVEGVKVNGKVYKIICGPKVIVTKKGRVVVISLLFILFYLFGCFRKKKSPNENWDALFNA